MVTLFAAADTALVLWLEIIFYRHHISHSNLVLPDTYLTFNFYLAMSGVRITWSSKIYGAGSSW